MCLVCNVWSSEYMPEASGRRSHCKLSTFRRHARLDSHRRLSLRFVGQPKEQLSIRAPPPGLFKELFCEFRKGACPDSGVELPSGTVLGEQKVQRMLWCLYQCILKRKREAIRSARVANILRDERHGRMHVRFRCTGKFADLTSGYMGQSRDHPPSSLWLSVATKKAFRYFCTLYQQPSHGLPPGREV